MKKLRPTLSAIYSTKTALWFARLCIELVQGAALSVKGARARRALQCFDICARWNVVWMHIDFLNEIAGLISSYNFQPRDTRDVASAK